MSDKASIMNFYLSRRVLLLTWLLLALSVPAAAQLRSLTILHTNDLHARLDNLSRPADL